MSAYRTPLIAFKPTLVRQASGAMTNTGLVRALAFDGDIETLTNEEATQNAQAGFRHTARIKTRYFPQLDQVREGWIIRRERGGQTLSYRVTSNIDVSEAGMIAELLVQAIK